MRIRPNDAKLRELILIISEWSQADPKFGAIKLNFSPNFDENRCHVRLQSRRSTSKRWPPAVPTSNLAPKFGVCLSRAGVVRRSTSIC